MRTPLWLTFAASLLITPFAQAVDTQPQPFIVAQGVPVPNPGLNPVAVVPAAPVVNPYLSQGPMPAYGGMFPFTVLPYVMPNMMPVPAGPAQTPQKPYSMHPIIPEQTRTQMMQMMMPMMTSMMHMTMPDAMNWMAYKIKAKPGVSFDDVIQSMNLRANQLNFKHVGVNPMWKDFQAVLGDKDAPRMEVHSYCDIAVARQLLKIDPEFIVFLPCRIDVMEDGDKNIWLLMLDWNMDWVAGHENQLGITPELAKDARRIRDNMVEIMRAGADGDI
jgi:uncharacterized protein (DUF302 family)